MRISAESGALGGGTPLADRVRVRSLALLLLLSTPALAETRRPLTLHDAIAAAFRGNPTYAVADADVRIAEGAVVAARGLDDFVLDAAGAWQRNRQPVIVGPSSQTPAVDAFTGTLALTKPLATGGRMGLRLNNSVQHTQFVNTAIDGMMSSRFVDLYAPGLQLTFQHPVLRGLGPSVARADQRRAAVQRDRATLERAAVAATLLRDVVGAYWDLALATQELDIRRGAAESAREQLRRVQANIDVGKQPRSASAEIEVAIALRDEGVLFAEQALLDRSLELGRLMGLPARDSTAFMAADPPEPPDERPELEPTLQAAMASSPQLQAVRTLGRAAAIEVDVTQNGLLPQLDLALAGGTSGSANDLRTAYEQIGGLDTYFVSASVVFQHPFGRHLAKGANIIAHEQQRKARLTEEDIGLQVTTAAVRAVKGVEIAARRVEVLGRSREAAALDLEAERARFEVGRSTNFDVLRRQQDLAQVQLAHMRARVDQLRAVAGVQTITGDILSAHGVSVR
jgi:outer membrane protein TolC